MHEWRMRVSVVLLLQVGVVLVPGLACRGGAPRGRAERLCSGNPLDRAEAVIEATEARDLTAVHKLVDLLEDPDAGVRMFAIVALQRLCGREYGYRYYEDDARRAVAVQRWREALRRGEVEVQPRVPATARAGADADVGVHPGQAEVAPRESGRP